MAFMTVTISGVCVLVTTVAKMIDTVAMANMLQKLKWKFNARMNLFVAFFMTFEVSISTASASERIEQEHSKKKKMSKFTYCNSLRWPKPQWKKKIEIEIEKSQENFIPSRDLWKGKENEKKKKSTEKRWKG